MGTAGVTEKAVRWPVLPYFWRVAWYDVHGNWWDGYGGFALTRKAQAAKMAGARAEMSGKNGGG